MNKVLFGLLTYLLVGCTTSPVYKIDLETAANSTEINNVTVHDTRLDMQLYMAESGVNGTHTYIFEVNPSLNTTLEGLVKSEVLNAQLNTDVDINIQNIETYRHVRFAADDELSCIIKSSVTVGKSTESIQVETIAKNDEDGDMPTATPLKGKLIINKCLVEHAQDLAQYIKELDK